MNPNIVKRNELLAQKVIKGLKSRNMTGLLRRDQGRGTGNGAKADSGGKFSYHGRSHERP